MSEHIENRCPLHTWRGGEGVVNDMVPEVQRKCMGC